MSKKLRTWLVVAILAGVAIGGVLAPLHNKGGLPTLDDFESGLIAAMSSAAIFVITYSIREPWWGNWFGRFIVSHVLAFALVCLPFILAFYFGLTRLDSEIADWVLLGAFYTSAAVLLLGTVLWLHTSMENARQRVAEKSATERLIERHRAEYDALVAEGPAAA